MPPFRCHTRFSLCAVHFFPVFAPVYEMDNDAAAGHFPRLSGYSPKRSSDAYAENQGSKSGGPPPPEP